MKGLHFGWLSSTAIPPNSSMIAKNKVLLIEDNPGDAKLVEIFLMESDLQYCEVITKSTLKDGMDALHSGEDFAAIFLDLTLPDSSGFETLEKLVAEFPQNNIIVLTGRSDKELGLKAVKAGAQDFLVKGAFDSDELSKTLRFSIERTKVLKRLEETQRIAHIGNWDFYPETGLFEASDEVYRIFGCSAADKGNAFPLNSLQEVHAAMKAENEIKTDLRIQRQDGVFIYVFIQCLASRTEDNKIVYQGIIQDINERKQAEHESAKSRERYQEIFTQSKDALFICTLDGKLIDCNQATLDLFRFDRPELLNVQDVHTFYRPVERKNEFLLKLKNQKSIKDYDIKIVNKSGEERECTVTANIISTEDFNGYNCILRDVTDLRQADEMRKARDLARHSAQMKEQFVASVSHEMRTPMNAILGMSNLLLQMDMEGEPLNLIKSIKHSSEILLGVVNDILEVSEIQNGKVVFENKPFDLQELLDNLVNVMQYKAQEKDLYLEIIQDEGIPRYISGDKLRLNQVLYNLVGNAIKFTDQGYVKVFIKKLHDIFDSVQLKFIVEDTGIGVPEDKIDAIFDTFTRIRQKDRLFEGTGLGLSICKNLVQAQGGKIGATSTLGKGSVFFFDLIFETVTASSMQTPVKNVKYPILPEDAIFTLLLVEDHKMNQLVARKTLERKWKNIQLTIAENGQIAIDLLREKDFDLILMDIQMPVMDGYAATKYIREQFPPEKAKMPILAMTAHAHISKDEKFKEYGMDNYVLKPFEPEDLFQKISEYIKK